MEYTNKDKNMRILALYAKLQNKEVIKTEEEARKHNVSKRTIARDIADIQNFLSSCNNSGDGVLRYVNYSRAEKGYRLEHTTQKDLTSSELLALSKILLDSRAFCKEEMSQLLDKLAASCAPEENQKLVKELLRNEEFHYIEPRHQKKLINTIWTIAQAIHTHNLIEIEYLRPGAKAAKTRRLQPAAILFSEYYFYLTAFIEDEKVRENFDVINDSFPTIYRIDRIQKLKVLEEKFFIRSLDRFEEGEFRKRVQFMYGGKLQKVRFQYTGCDIDAILDRLPTAQVLKEENGVYTLEAEVFGKGIEMWFRSQGDAVSEITCLKK